MIASRSLRREERTVSSSWIEGANAFCGIVWADGVVVGGGSGLVFWYSGGACLDLERDKEEKELVSLELASLFFVSVAEAKRWSSSSRLRAQSFM